MTDTRSCTVALKVVFDSGHGRKGHQEHFFHFMFGYLLPGLHMLKELRDAGDLEADDRIAWSDCGPVMNGVLREAFSLFDINGVITTQDEDDARHLPVSRWDIWLIRRANNASATSHDQPGDDEMFTAFCHVRKEGLSRLQADGQCETPSAHHLLLKRSEQPPYYYRGGGAAIKSYGASRRALLGLEQTALDLQAKGIDAKVYEPGIDSFENQIRQFSAAESIIGIRGAEFANSFWMQPGTRVVLLRPTSLPSEPPQRVLAELLGLGYHEINIGDKNYYELKANMLTDVISP